MSPTNNKSLKCTFLRVFLIKKKQKQWQLLLPRGSNSFELISLNNVFLRRSKWDPEKTSLNAENSYFCLKLCPQLMAEAKALI